MKEVEHGSFSLLIFSMSGGMGPIATVIYKQIATLIAEKRDQPYSRTLFGFTANSASHYCALPLCASEYQGPHTITQLAWLGKPLTSPTRRAESRPRNREQTLRYTYSTTTSVMFILSFYCFIYFPTSFIHVLWPLQLHSFVCSVVLRCIACA